MKTKPTADVYLSNSSVIRLARSAGVKRISEKAIPIVAELFNNKLKAFLSLIEVKVKKNIITEETIAGIFKDSFFIVERCKLLAVTEPVNVQIDYYKKELNTILCSSKRFRRLVDRYTAQFYRWKKSVINFLQFQLEKEVKIILSNAVKILEFKKRKTLKPYEIDIVKKIVK
jgi:histone H3/H4